MNAETALQIRAALDGNLGGLGGLALPSMWTTNGEQPSQHRKRNSN